MRARLDDRAHEFMPPTLLESHASLEELEIDEAHVIRDITQPLELLAELMAQEIGSGR